MTVGRANVPRQLKGVQCNRKNCDLTQTVGGGEVQLQEEPTYLDNERE